MPAAPLPAVVKTYSARGNTPFQDNTTALNLSRSIIFSLVKHMLDTLVTGTLFGTRHANSVWTVRYSCDGVTAGTAGDGIDRWTTIANLIWAANGALHSWFVLRNTTLGYEICVDLNNLAGTNVGIAVAEIATPFTGGTNLTRPTATNEFMMGATGTGPTINFIFLGDAVTGNFNWTHYITADDGQFYFLCSRTGLGVFSTFMAVQKTVGQTLGDTRNVFAMGHGVSSGRGSPSWGAVGAAAAGCVGRFPNGVVNTIGGIQASGHFGATAWPGGTGIDAVTGNYLVFPNHVASLGAVQPTYRGNFPDQYAVGQAPVGGAIPSAAAQERIIAGDFIIPFPGVNPTM